MQNYDTVNHPDWHEPETDHILICDSCYNVLNEFEQDDPCEVDGSIFCDRCGSDYIAFRCGTLRNVSDMTHELKINAAPTVSEINMVDYVTQYFGYSK